MKESEEKAAKTEEESTDKVTVIIMCITTTVVSVSMILLNKAIVLSVPFSGGLVLLQNTATILLVQSYKGFRVLIFNAMTQCHLTFLKLLRTLRRHFFDRACSTFNIFVGYLIL